MTSFSSSTSTSSFIKVTLKSSALISSKTSSTGISIACSSTVLSTASESVSSDALTAPIVKIVSNINVTNIIFLNFIFKPLLIKFNRITTLYFN